LHVLHASRKPGQQQQQQQHCGTSVAQRRSPPSPRTLPEQFTSTRDDLLSRRLGRETLPQSVNQSINQLVNPRDVFENTFEAKAKASAFWGQ